MRLIDADAFKAYIRNAYEQLKHMYRDGGKLAGQITEDFCKDIDEQPTIDQQKWIPVSERLPNEEEDVLVTVHFLGLEQKHPNGWNDHIKENYYVDIACQIDGEWSSYSDEYKVARSRHVVVAWMPLPEPYKGE